VLLGVTLSHARLIAKGRLIPNESLAQLLTAMVKNIDPDVFMEQAASDYVLAVRVLHAGSIVMTHAVEGRFSGVASRLCI
jgi:hypothetical protein